MGFKKHPHKRPMLKTKTDCSIRVLCARLSAVMVCAGVSIILVCILEQRSAFDGLVLIMFACLFMAMARGFRHVEVAFKKIRMLFKN